MSFKCRGCQNIFVQDELCVTCGAQKLYDNTVTNLENRITKLVNYINRMLEGDIPYGLGDDMKKWGYWDEDGYPVEDGDEDDA